ncbi:MAG TPA: phosphotransferase [Thermoanaerobaculia bacterium]|jgi:Ser/Thr protein kinase RdoA (MazF antagonist)
MLNVDNAAEYLIERGLMSVDSILSGDLIISSAARRNRNLRIKRKDDPSYLIKQPDDPASGARQTLRAEAQFYSFCFEDAEAEPVREFLPALRYFDPERSLVVFDFLDGAVPLWQYSGSREEASRLVGHALGTFHRTFRGTQNRKLGWLQRQTPWVMRVHKPSPELLASLSPANVETLRILQTQEQISTHLDALRRKWRVETVIHNDVKSDNILVRGSGPGAQGPGPSSVALVDWELVQLGDPAWDVAGLLQDFVLLWVTSMTVTPGATTDMLAASARLPLADLQRAIRAFWKGYRAAAGQTPAEEAQLITRAVAYSAARLIQSAYEMGAVTPALAPASVLLLQVSANLLRDPEAGQVQLYGLIQGYVPA